MLNFLCHYVTLGNYGFAILLLTVIIRALLHPLTRASQVNMATMGKKMKGHPAADRSQQEEIREGQAEAN